MLQLIQNVILFTSYYVKGVFTFFIHGQESWHNSPQQGNANVAAVYDAGQQPYFDSKLLAIPQLFMLQRSQPIYGS